MSQRKIVTLVTIIKENKELLSSNSSIIWLRRHILVSTTKPTHSQTLTAKRTKVLLHQVLEFSRRVQIEVDELKRSNWSRIQKLEVGQQEINNQLVNETNQ